MHRARGQLARGPGTHSLYIKLCSSAEQGKAEPWKREQPGKWPALFLKPSLAMLPIISFLNECSRLPQFSLINSDLLLIYFLYSRENDLSLQIPCMIMEDSGLFESPQCLPLLLGKAKLCLWPAKSFKHWQHSLSRLISCTTPSSSLLHWFWSWLFTDSFNYSAKLYQSSAFCPSFFFTLEKWQLIKQMQNKLIWIIFLF